MRGALETRLDDAGVGRQEPALEPLKCALLTGCLTGCGGTGCPSCPRLSALRRGGGPARGGMNTWQRRGAFESGTGSEEASSSLSGMRRRAAPSPSGSSPSLPPRKLLALPNTPPTNEDLTRLFKCRECSDFALPPIIQCESGHLVCGSCRPKLSRCPICRIYLGSIRNLALENLAESLLFPCKYIASGCEVTLRHTVKADHEEMCRFRPYPCPCPGAECIWRGPLDAMTAHLLQHHDSLKTLHGDEVLFQATGINLPDAAPWVMLQSCFGYYFILVLEKQENYDGHQQFFAIAQLIGTREQAEKFTFRFKLIGEMQRLTWEGTPTSIDEGIAAAIAKNNCLVFETSIAQLFAKNDNLNIKGTVSMH
ncbi:E3 ubiquitin-protein ligase SIAH1-like [Suricata suricatta]|uniref:E3 ubiquitin-protein ligase n=1 Tax=Suricata suricatta TaxID=37032 RepID=A0A673V2U3_SURSU|nr:E3 ubiquitin-protein ligase SIAH1-like [Suricata suricatta]